MYIAVSNFSVNFSFVQSTAAPCCGWFTLSCQCWTVTWCTTYVLRWWGGAAALGRQTIHGASSRRRCIFFQIKLQGVKWPITLPRLTPLIILLTEYWAIGLLSDSYMHSVTDNTYGEDRGFRGQTLPHTNQRIEILVDFCARKSATRTLTRFSTG